MSQARDGGHGLRVRRGADRRGLPALARIQVDVCPNARDVCCRLEHQGRVEYLQMHNDVTVAVAVLVLVFFFCFQASFSMREAELTAMAAMAAEPPASPPLAEAGPLKIGEDPSRHPLCSSWLFVTPRACKVPKVPDLQKLNLGLARPPRKASSFRLACWVRPRRVFIQKRELPHHGNAHPPLEPGALEVLGAPCAEYIMPSKGLFPNHLHLQSPHPSFSKSVALALRMQIRAGACKYQRCICLARLLVRFFMPMKRRFLENPYVSFPTPTCEQLCEHCAMKGKASKQHINLQTRHTSVTTTTPFYNQNTHSTIRDSGFDMRMPTLQLRDRRSHFATVSLCLSRALSHSF